MKQSFAVHCGKHMWIAIEHLKWPKCAQNATYTSDFEDLVPKTGKISYYQIFILITY